MMFKRKLPVLTAICLFALSQPSQANENEPTDQTSRSEVVIVVGAPGTPEYGEQFADWADAWSDVSEQAAAAATVIGRSETDESSDRDRLQKRVATFADSKQEVPNTLWLVLIGHGTFSQDTAKFNLRGPDVSAAELAQWLDGILSPVVIVNCASSSGPFINRLSGPNRVIVTATKSGTEQNYTRFGKFMAQAISSPESDLDHDDEVSVHEAFLRASAEVRQFYEDEGRISTEHALIDDNADARGTPAAMFRGTRPIAEAKDGAQLDGRAASRFTLTPAAKRLPFTPAELTQRNELETRLEELRAKRSSLDEAAFDAELEPLLVKLAKIYRAAEKRQQETE
ncbi:hypothetical protein [Allorhodopirellula solitaria]|uniref:Caspase domain protein n=1 Tax=Allorhodopirellula solitaria TaxID=2527987 RepID=A0A5C5YKD8_9BACT|nr:hypothetical protein [Allorhodopirellula solitaria]TWT75385.1 hypothetical protein CA85_06760 [Allorhodopirellula solitaria]